MYLADSKIWPVELIATAAGHHNVLTAPNNIVSYYITGILGHTASKVFSILRQSYPALTANATWTVADHGDVQLIANEDFLFTFWVKLSSSGVSKTIFTKSTAEDYYALTTGSGGLPSFSLSESGGDNCTVAGTTNICDGAWHFVCVGGDRSVEQGLTMYIDGAAEATNAADDKLTEVGIAGSTGDLVFTAPTGDMSLSTFGLYTDTAFTAAAQAIEVTRLYNGGMGKIFEGTETYLTFGCNMTDGETTDTLAVKGTTTAAVSAATWTDGGVPFDTDSPLGTLIDIISTIAMEFPHPIKVGAGCPLQIETSAAMNLLIFGREDSK